MFLNAIELSKTLPCLAEPGRIIVVGRPSRLLRDVLHYMATLPDVIAYNPDVPALTFRRPSGFLTLYAEQVYITQVRDGEEGLELLAALTEAINATWEHRDKLAAVTARRHAPRPLDVWALLPQTNCKQCGEATCLAFAFMLIQHRRTVTDCLPLQADAVFADRQAALEAML